jgi:hypothetical protein
MQRLKPTKFLVDLYSRVEARQRLQQQGRREGYAKGRSAYLAKVWGQFGKAEKDQSTRETAVTKDEATTRLAKLSHDAGFRERLFAGDAEARGEWTELQRIAAGHAPTPTGTSKSAAQARLDSLLADPSWRTRRLTGDVQAEAEFNELAAILAGSEG